MRNPVLIIDISLKATTRPEQAWWSMLMPSLYDRRLLPRGGTVIGWYCENNIWFIQCKWNSKQLKKTHPSINVVCCISHRSHMEREISEKAMSAMKPLSFDHIEGIMIFHSAFSSAMNRASTCALGPFLFFSFIMYWICSSGDNLLVLTFLCLLKLIKYFL